MSRKVKVTLIFLAICLVIVALVGCGKEDPKYVAKVKNEIIPDGLFMAMFNETLDKEHKNEDSPLNFKLEGEKFFKQLEETKTKSGETYLDYFINESLEKAKQVMVAKLMAVSAGKWLSKEDQEKYRAEAKSELEYAMSYYNYYGYSFSSLNEFAGMVYGMTSDNYMEYYVLNIGVSEYESVLSKTVEVTEEALQAFYNENVDLYRIVTVRHSLFKTEGLNDTEKTTLRETVEGYIEKFNNGEMTMDEIVAKSGDTSSDGKVNNDGYYDVVANGQYVAAFENWAVKQEEVSDKLEIIDTEFGYHIMQCTGIKALEDKDVKASVEVGYTAACAADIIVEESKKSEYAPKEIDKKYINKIILRSLTGDFAEDDSEATTAPSAIPVEYDDAEPDKTVIAKFGDTEIYSPYYTEFYTQAMQELLLKDLKLPEDLDTKGRYEYVKEQLQKEYSEGVTYSQAIKEKAFELLLQFMVTKQQAIAADYGYTEEEISKLEAELDTNIDQMLQYYGSYYGISTRDEFMKMYVGMNVADYKPLYIDQTLVNEYSKAMLEKITASDDEITEYYEQHVDALRVVTIRRILRSTVDSKGNSYTDEQKADVYKVIEAILKKIDSGDSLSALAKAWSEDENVDTDEGLLDLIKEDSDYDDDMKNWIFSQTEIGAKNVFETENGYEIIVIEGITTLTEQKGTVTDTEDISCKVVKEQISQLIINDKYNQSVKDYIAENNLSLTDINWDLAQKAEEAFLTYEEETEDSDSKK